MRRFRHECTQLKLATELQKFFRTLLGTVGHTSFVKVFQRARQV
jgi:hypothetical protein